jgi:membrane-associated protease RseP (regulator of RpoE activity)
MRKLTRAGMATLMLAVVVGSGYAQDTTPAPTGTPVPATTETVSQKPWLGIAISDAEAGVTVNRIQRGSSAETAGLQQGDVILSVNGTDIASGADLKALVDAAAVGDVLSLSVQRGEETVTVDVTLGSRDDVRGDRMPMDALTAAEWAVGADLTEGDAGYEVVTGMDQTRFELVAGDVITAVNGEAIADVDWAALLVPTTPGEANTITLTVQRDGSEITLEGQLMFGGRGGHGHGRGDKGGMGGDRDGAFPGGPGRDNGPQDNAPVAPDNAPATPAVPGSSNTTPNTSGSSSL